MLQGNWKSWLSFFTGKPHTCVRRSAKSAFRPGVETLEHRWVPSGNASIGGTAFIDATGNGLAAGDAAQSGVTIRLYREDQHRILEIASQKTAANGSFDFKNLSAGNYFVSEDAPRNWVQTTPAVPSYYSINLTAHQAVTGEDFANFKTLNTGVITHVSFTITDPTRGTYTVTNLRGKTQQGDTVTANFTVRGTASVVVSLEVYDAPGATFDARTAGQQVIVSQDSVTLSPGVHSLTVQLPDNFYQVDLVLGAPITTLGPAGSNLFYSAQGRLISADNGGTQAFAAGSLSGNVYDDANGTGVFTSANDTPLPGVTVTLTGVNDLGQSITLSAVTDAQGNYTFAGLRAGTYTISDVTPGGFNDELSSSDGSLGGSLAVAGQVSDIVLHNGQTGINYDLPVTKHGGLSPV